MGLPNDMCTVISKHEKIISSRPNFPQNLSISNRQAQQNFNPRPYVQKQSPQPNQQHNFQRNNNFQSIPFHSNLSNNNYTHKSFELPKQNKPEPMHIDPRSSQVP